MKPIACHLRRLAALAAAAALPLLPAVQAQNAIPLSLQTIGNAQRLVIYAGINSSTPPVPYLFDTGSAGFNAAYYNGNYTGSGANPAAWTPSSTVSSGATISYGTDASGFSYLLNAVTVDSIQIYQESDLSTPYVSLIATDFSPQSNGYVIGQVTDMTYVSGATSNFQSNLQQGLPPFSSGVYGTFGAGMFTGNNTSGSAAYVNGSVLGQSTAAGWAVVANTGVDTGSAWAILGLDDAIRSQFSSSVAWTVTSDYPYPSSNATACTEFGGGQFDFTLSDTAGVDSPVSWTSNTLLDTGTQNNNLNYPGVHKPLAPYETNKPQVDAGYVITAAGVAQDAGADSSYSFTTTAAGSSPVTYTANVKSLDGNATDVSNSTVGVGFFLANSVAFDLQNQQTLYTTETVVIPTAQSDAVTMSSTHNETGGGTASNARGAARSTFSSKDRFAIKVRTSHPKGAALPKPGERFRLGVILGEYRFVGYTTDAIKAKYDGTKGGYASFVVKDKGSGKPATRVRFQWNAKGDLLATVAGSPPRDAKGGAANCLDLSSYHDGPVIDTMTKCATLFGGNASRLPAGMKVGFAGRKKTSTSGCISWSVKGGLVSSPTILTNDR